MSLALGARLGPYEIQSAIGAGGMGEVYRARDTRLDRTVAIKLLPPGLSADPDRRARLEREAKTVASLSHPHICVLHDVGDHEGSLFLVMEHLAGQTLAERLAKGALPVEQALAIAAEIADALSAAHREGIIHRDLKPANVMLTKTGAKLLDFGLARLAETGAGVAASTTASRVGTIAGTLPYMAPEQVQGGAIDARTDLFAFGAVLYEMVTGKRAFEGESAASLMAAILDREPPPIASRQPLAPPALDTLVRKCLSKAPDDRPDTAHDLAGALRWIRDSSGPGGGEARLPPGRRTKRVARLAAAAVLLASLGAAVGWFVAPRSGPSHVVRFAVNIAPADAIRGTDKLETVVSRPHATAIALSPDGRLLVYSASSGQEHALYSRPLDRDVASRLAGSENGEMPFFSPDGRWIGFWADGALRKIPVGSGPAVDVCRTARPNGATWAADGTIVFGGEDDVLWQVPEGGGRPSVLLGAEQANGESSRLPHALPGGKGLLYTSVEAADGDWSRWRIMARVAATGERKVLVERGADARYLPSGHLLFVRAGKLLAVPFDLAGLRVTGGEVAVADNIMQAFNAGTVSGDSGAAQVAVADTGVLALVRGGIVPDSRYSIGVVAGDGSVRQLSQRPEPNPYLMPRLSPDGKRVAAWNVSMIKPGLWVFDLERGTLSKPVLGLAARHALWSRDGRWIVFAGVEKSRFNLFRVSADGGAPPDRLTRSGFDQVPASWGAGGRELVFLELHPDSGFDVMAMAMDTRKVRPLVRTPSVEEYPAVSPDGRWLAYTSDTSGRREVYVQPYAGGEAVAVSAGGASAPIWSRDGRRLFFSRSAPGSALQMFSVEVSAGDRFACSRQRTVFEMPDWLSKIMGAVPVHPYDLAPDGRGFLVATIEKDDPVRYLKFPTEIAVIVNWFEELKAKVPTEW